MRIVGSRTGACDARPGQAYACSREGGVLIPWHMGPLAARRRFADNVARGSASSKSPLRFPCLLYTSPSPRD
eukprot:3184611-Alexandrium_andersonii.AAC.1